MYSFIPQERETEVKKKQTDDGYSLPGEISVLKVGCAGNNPALGECAFSALSDLLRIHCPPKKGLRTTCTLSYFSYAHRPTNIQ